jgi:hypothetical protein
MEHLSALSLRSAQAAYRGTAAVVVLFGPAAWFPLPLAIIAYVVLGVVAALGAARWFLQATGRTPKPRTQPPPAPAPPP